MSRRCFATVVTKSYLANARALASSIRKFHDDPIYVLCVDDPTGYFDPTSEPFIVLQLDDVLPAQERPALFYYTAFEMCCALKAYLQRFIFTHTPIEYFVFLDSDVLVTSSLETVFQELHNGPIGLLTPHCIKPAPQKLLETAEIPLLRYGVYNAGFLAFRRSAEWQQFLDWFIERLRTLCFFDERGVYCEQLWLNLVPEAFPEIQSWRHPGANVAYWNLHERVISRGRDGYAADGHPLLFVHFSRWNIDNPEDWSFGRPIAQKTDRDALASLGREYRDALLACKYRESRRWPYGFARFASGREITKAMRRAYYDDWIAGNALPGSPFEHPEWFPVWKYPPDVTPVLRRVTAPIRVIRNKLRGK